MSITELVTTILASSSISAATVGWLAKRLIEHRLTKNIEQTKSELQAQLDRGKAILEGSIREQVETALGDRAADREYELEARKRLLSLPKIPFRQKLVVLVTK
jgi:hypothetical protein